MPGAALAFSRYRYADALEAIRTVRPRASPNMGFALQLRRWGNGARIGGRCPPSEAITAAARAAVSNASCRDGGGSSGSGGGPAAGDVIGPSAQSGEKAVSFEGKSPDLSWGAYLSRGVRV